MEPGVAPRNHHRVRNTILVVGPIVLIILGIFVAGVWLAGQQQRDGLVAIEGTSVDVTTLPQTVPFRSVAGHIVVDVSFGDSDETIPMILDSGAPVIVSDAIAGRFGGESVGQTRLAAIDGSVLSSDVVSVAQLRIGDVLFNDVGAIKGFIGPDNPLSCISSNGLIGASLMKEAVWQIDYGTGQLTIAETVSGLDHIEGALVLGFSSPSSASPSPQLDIAAGDEFLTFVLDTGSDGGLTVNPADLEAIGLDVDVDGPAYRVRAAGVAGTYDARVLYAAVGLQLGDQQLDAYPVATLESLQAGQGNIGNEFLDGYVVTIDWPQNRIYLDPRSDDPRPPLPPAATLGWDGERIIVGSLVEGSGPASAGLAVGQAISAIDGLEVIAATRDDFCEFSVAGLPDTFTLTTDDGRAYSIATTEDFFGPLGD